VLVQQYLRADGVNLHGQSVLLHDEGHKGEHTGTAAQLNKLLSLCMLLAFEQPLLQLVQKLNFALVFASCKFVYGLPRWLYLEHRRLWDRAVLDFIVAVLLAVGLE
jgi:hypothetical protein